jgi:Bacterial Ig-like domain
MSVGVKKPTSTLRIFYAVFFASLGLAGCGGEQPSDESGQTVVVMSATAETAPAVSSTAPANNASDVGLNTSVSATFSRTMSGSSVNAASFSLRPSSGGAAVIGNIGFSGDTATFAPTSTLTANTQYTATISADVTDTNGTPLDADYIWQFTTGAASDTTPPTVSSTAPSRNAVGVALNSSVSATFSEPMANSTLNSTSFKLQRVTAGNPAIMGTVLVSGNTATFTPIAALAGNTTYRATITTAAQDAAGNALAVAYTWDFTTDLNPDMTAPTVSSVSPPRDASGITPNTTISASFSEAMTNATLTNATFTVSPYAGGAVVVGTVNVSGNTATFSPTTGLADSTRYVATISGTVRDAAGNALGTDYTWRFTTGAAPDTTAPTVATTSPASDETGITINAPIAATFSEPMDNATLNTANFTLRVPGGAYVSGTVNVSGNTATFTPATELAGNTRYRARISTAAKDAAGNALENRYTWFFTTGAAPDNTPPTVSSESPARNASNVALNSPVSVTFSEAMNNSTLSTATFTLRPAAGGANVAGTVNVSGNTATFTPSTSLDGNTQYRATISSVVTDAAGNALASDHVWQFTSGAPTSTALLEWDAVSFPDFSGYRVYYGTAPGTYLQAVGTGIYAGNTTSYTVPGLTSGTRYYFAVTAIDGSGNESPYSNEVFKDIP